MASGDEFIVQVQRVDGGISSKDSPANIDTIESPDCLNVTFDDRGAVQTRYGAAYFNTSAAETGANKLDGVASFNGSLLVWAGGSMFRASGTTFVTIGSAQGAFTSGAKIAYSIYQNMLIHSDGTNGPYRYHDPNSFYQLGIFTPSAPTAASNLATAAGAGPETGTYYYAISAANTAAVEGEPGSVAVAVTLGTTAVVNVTSIPTGAASWGVATRYVYRASTNTLNYRRVGTLSDNTTSIFTDTMGATTWSVQTTSVDDSTRPTPFTTVKLHKDVLWFDDSSERTLARYTDYGVPYISQAENFIPLNKGDKSPITAIGVQDDFVTCFKEESTWIIDMVTPATPSTYVWDKSPSNLGIVGVRAFVETDNGIVFVGRRNGKISGLHLLSGVRVEQTSDNKLRSDSISERIEPDILAIPSASWSSIALGTFNNAVYMSYKASGDSQNAHGYWFDLNRLFSQGQPGSWAPWDGLPTKINSYAVHDGSFYGGSDVADGYLVKIIRGTTYTDGASTAINSYWWSKKLGGDDPASESWYKDWRKINLFYALQGAYMMNVRYRVDGDTGSGITKTVNLNPGGSVWGAFTWGSGTWGGTGDDAETIVDLAGILGRRIQFRFDNQNTSGQSFKVYRFNSLGNLRRRV